MAINETRTRIALKYEEKTGRIEDRGKIPLEIKIYAEGKIQW